MNNAMQGDFARAKRLHHRQRLRARAERAYAVVYNAPDHTPAVPGFRWIGQDGHGRLGLPTWEDVHEYRRVKAVRDTRLARLFAPNCGCARCTRLPGKSMHERRAAHSAREQLCCLSEDCLS